MRYSLRENVTGHIVHGNVGWIGGGVLSERKQVVAEYDGEQYKTNSKSKRERGNDSIEIHFCIARKIRQITMTTPTTREKHQTKTYVQPEYVLSTPRLCQTE
jgi:hypothetical protein